VPPTWTVAIFFDLHDECERSLVQATGDLPTARCGKHEIGCLKSDGAIAVIHIRARGWRTGVEPPATDDELPTDQASPRKLYSESSVPIYKSGAARAEQELSVRRYRCLERIVALDSP
jgi:hypothetical protein